MTVRSPGLLGVAVTVLLATASAGCSPSPSNPSAGAPARSGPATGAGAIGVTVGVRTPPGATAQITDASTPTVTGVATDARPTSHPTASPAGRSPSGRPAASDLRLPVRAAFYYPWFPQAWRQGGVEPFTHWTPTAGLYDGTAAATVDRHIADLRYAGMQAGIASWWGVGSKEDRRVPLLLARARRVGFHWSLYYEPEGQGDPSPVRITADLAHLRRAFTADPAYARLDGRALLFVYADPGDGCATARRWRQADTTGFYVVLKVFSGYRTCDAQPSGWHQYAPAVGRDHQQGRSFSVSPGFWLVGAAERLPRDLARFRADVRAMKASGEPFQLVTTYNEWGEGTAVESAKEWASPSGRGHYLDVLHAELT